MEVGEAVQSLVSRAMSLVISQKKEEHEPAPAPEASPRRSPEDVGKGLEKWREEELDDRDKDCCSICLDPFTNDDPAKKTTCGLAGVSTSRRAGTVRDVSASNGKALASVRTFEKRLRTKLCAVADVLTTCCRRHHYHLQCIMMWSQRSKECPLCMGKLQMEDPETADLLSALLAAQQEEEEEVIGVDVEFARILRHLSALSRPGAGIGMEVGYPASSLRFHRRNSDGDFRVTGSSRRSSDGSSGGASRPNHSRSSGLPEPNHTHSSTHRRKTGGRQEAEGSPAMKQKSGFAKIFADFKRKFRARPENI
eukprot:scaffold525_cov307-Pavlova_lutheri.AAC.3